MLNGSSILHIIHRVKSTVLNVAIGVLFNRKML